MGETILFWVAVAVGSAIIVNGVVATVAAWRGRGLRRLLAALIGCGLGVAVTITSEWMLFTLFGYLSWWPYVAGAVVAFLAARFLTSSRAPADLPGDPKRDAEKGSSKGPQEAQAEPGAAADRPRE